MFTKRCISTIIVFFLLLSSTPLLVSSAKCHKDDKKALLKLRAGFGSPQGSLAWSPDTPCCSWGEVNCSLSGRVVGLLISSADLNGTISPVIGDLPFLTSITIQYTPGLTGSIPPSITKLPLTWLIIRFTSLSGHIPGFLGSLNQLNFLDLSNNHFTGSIPPSIVKLPLTDLYLGSAGLSGPIPGFLGELKQLTNLDLSDNRLTGRIPDSVAALPNLNWLVLSKNKISGGIPSSLFRGLTNRNRLDLSDNLLTGEIPRSIGEANLSLVFLAGNRLVGDASFLFGESKQLWQIDLSRNLLEFNMSELGFPKELGLLKLSENRIYGSIPESVAGLIDLLEFNVSYNRLCGKIPLLKFPPSCYHHNKCLCGSPLPSCHAEAAIA